MNSPLASHVSRRGLLGFGAAAAAGFAIAGHATSALAADDGADPKAPSGNGVPDGGFSTTNHFTDALVRLPGTSVALFGPRDVYCVTPLNYPGDGGVYPTVNSTVEIGLTLPAGAVIRQIDVFGSRSAAGGQSWKFQIYDPTNFGFFSQPGLYQGDSTGVGGLRTTLAIPAVGIPVLENGVYAVYGNADSVSRLHGVAVQYSAPAAPPTPVKGFQPINPARVYDSRAAAPSPGPLARTSSRVVSVKDGRDGSGVVISPDIVPAGATAVTFNVTATGASGANYLSVAPGDAAGFTTSTLNWPGGFDIANASTVKIDANRQVKVFMGDQSGSSHFIIDVTGYYI